MKIGITCYPSLGGSGIVATELGKFLAERGHTVHFITSGVPFRLGTYMRNIYYHEVEVNSYSVFRYPPYDLTLASRMAQVARMAELDLLHVHYAVPHAVSAYLAKLMVGDHLKVVTTLHGTDITVLGYDPTLIDIIRFGIQRSDYVTAVSESLIQETKQLICHDQEIACIYNFIDPAQYYRHDVTTLRREYVNLDQKLLVHLSNFRKVKRAPDCVRILQQVRQQVDAKLLFIGEGPELPAVQQLTFELGLQDYVMFLGKQEDITPMLSMADLMLLPSEKESFGLSALEAMACGVPVIASRAGGIPEVVIHGETGFLAPIGAVDQMAADALKLLKHPMLWAEMSQHAVNWAKTHFAAERIVTQYEEIYRKVLEGEGRREGA